MTASSLLDLGTESFVLLTTFRRTGERVATPVWVARAGEQLIVMTPADSGKVKRIRHNAVVELTPCDRRGQPQPWAVTHHGIAVIRDQLADVEAAHNALKAKYGLQFRLFMGIEQLARRLRETPRVAVWIRPADAATPDAPASNSAGTD